MWQNKIHDWIAVFTTATVTLWSGTLEPAFHILALVLTVCFLGLGVMLRWKEYKRKPDPYDHHVRYDDDLDTKV